MNASLTSPWLEAPSPKCAITAESRSGSPVPTDAVALHAHRVAGGVQGLGADDDRVEAEVVLGRVPVAVVDAAEQAEQLERVEAAAPGDAVLAVGREDEVLRAQRAAGADLGGLLAEQLGPDAELAVALQRGGLGVDAADQDHVAVEAAQLVRGEVPVELGVVDPLALRRQQLDQLGAAVLLGGAEDLGEIGPESGGSAMLAGSWRTLLRGLGRCGVSGAAGSSHGCGDQVAGHRVAGVVRAVSRVTSCAAKVSVPAGKHAKRPEVTRPVRADQRRPAESAGSACGPARPVRLGVGVAPAASAALSRAFCQSVSLA